MSVEQFQSVGSWRALECDLSLLCRRDVVAIMFGALACMEMPAQAAAPKYEQMDALKGKDYGKVRTK